MKEIQLTQGKVALVDDDDFEFLSAYKWHAAKDGQTWYAQRGGAKLASGKGGVQRMHQLILPGTHLIDHQDGNGLNNQRKNIRPATAGQNAQNRQKRLISESGFKGVCWYEKNNQWGARIGVEGRYVFLGTFETPEQAALAYDLAALKFHGKFSRLNFPDHPHLLAGTRVYTIGHMEYKDGQGWRKCVADSLGCLGITVFDPYHKPFLNDVPENSRARAQLSSWMGRGQFDKVAERMKAIRNFDLRMCDIADFFIAHIQPEIASWGSAEEITTVVRQKKPIFLSVAGGKRNTPLWLMGMLPHRYIYDSVQQIIDVITAIDLGTVELSSDRWKLLRPELR